MAAAARVAAEALAAAGQEAAAESRRPARRRPARRRPARSGPRREQEQASEEEEEEEKQPSVDTEMAALRRELREMREEVRNDMREWREEVRREMLNDMQEWREEARHQMLNSNRGATDDAALRKRVLKLEAECRRGRETEASYNAAWDAALERSGFNESSEAWKLFCETYERSSTNPPDMWGLPRAHGGTRWRQQQQQQQQQQRQVPHSHRTDAATATAAEAAAAAAAAPAAAAPAAADAPGPKPGKSGTSGNHRQNGREWDLRKGSIIEVASRDGGRTKGTVHRLVGDNEVIFTPISGVGSNEAS